MATAMAICDFLAAKACCLDCDGATVLLLWPPRDRALCSSWSHESMPGGEGALRIKWEPSCRSWIVKSIVYLELVVVAAMQNNKQ